MSWEFVITKPAAGAVEQAVEPAMNDEEFAAFYQRSAPSLRAYLWRVSGDAALADDLMQESYLRFLCSSHPEDGEVSCRKYLFRIATNLLRDHWRRPKHTSIDDAPEEFVTARMNAGGFESQVVLGPALAKMKPRERQLLWLAHAEDYTHREIAEITGLGATSIRLLLFRARRKIAKLLRQQALARGGTA
jgi:RNA polymerase sigma-70 factor (ECF subfamily)